MNEFELQDSILRQALELERLAASDQDEALRIMEELERDLRALLDRADLTNARRREINAILKSANEVIEQRYAGIAGVVDTREIIAMVSQQTVNVVSLLGEALAPTPERLASLAKEVLIDGAPSSAWWSKQAEDLQFKFARTVREGVIDGATNEQIVARVLGRGDEVGIMDTARRNVRTLVHSSIMTAANQARLETFKKNAKFTSGIRWLATLDGLTCPTCIALDGRAWDLEGNPIDQEGEPMQFQLPPAHFSCRCAASPIPASLDEAFGVSGIDAIFARDQVRATRGGPTAATTFSEFLRRQSPEFVEEMLGPGRAALWQQGKITLRDLVSGSGRGLTLDQIRARI